MNNKIDTLKALCHFLNDYHGGQWSKGYRYLCITLRRLMDNGVYYPLDRKLTKKQKVLYNYLVEKYQDNV